MAQGAATRIYVGKHVLSVTTHSVTIDLADGTFGPEVAARRIYVDSAGSGTLVVRTPFSKTTATTTFLIVDKEVIDLAVMKILPASNFTRLKVYW